MIQKEMDRRWIRDNGMDHYYPTESGLYASFQIKFYVVHNERYERRTPPAFGC